MQSKALQSERCNPHPLQSQREATQNVTIAKQCYPEYCECKAMQMQSKQCNANECTCNMPKQCSKQNATPRQRRQISSYNIQPKEASGNPVDKVSTAAAIHSSKPTCPATTCSQARTARATSTSAILCLLMLMSFYYVTC